MTIGYAKGTAISWNESGDKGTKRHIYCDNTSCGRGASPIKGKCRTYSFTLTEVILLRRQDLWLVVQLCFKDLYLISASESLILISFREKHSSYSREKYLIVKKLLRAEWGKVILSFKITHINQQHVKPKESQALSFYFPGLYSQPRRQRAIVHLFISPHSRFIRTT